MVCWLPFSVKDIAIDIDKYIEQKSKVTVNYRAFRPFSDNESNIAIRLQRIKALVQSGLHDNAISESLELIQLGLDGLRYLQTFVCLYYTFSDATDSDLAMIGCFFEQ